MAFGIIGLPIPDETILTFAGYLVSQKNLQPAPTIIASFLGSISGISISFFIGHTFGLKLLFKYGRALHLTPDKLAKTKKWLEGYGSWTFLFGYFIPGIRHIIAIIAGSTETNYFKFSLFAYIGGFLWSLTFISLGYFAGEKWMALIGQVHSHILIFVSIILLIVIIYFLLKYKLFKKK